MQYPGVWCMSSAVAAFFLIYNTATATEGMSLTLTVLNYVLIVLTTGMAIFWAAFWYFKPRQDF